METKAWYLSTTLQGSIVTMIGLILSWVKFDGVTTEDVSTVVAAIFTVTGVVYTIIGRIKTKGETLTIK